VAEIDPLRAFGLLQGADLQGEASAEIGQDQSVLQGAPSLGEVLQGRFRLVRPLGRGAMGTVFLGLDESLEREVAIKVLAIEGDAARERFRREAEVTARLSHANVVRIHGSGQVRGHLYLVYELIDGGQTLKEALESEPLERRLDLVEGVAAGVAAAHAAGVVHRDLKPENVLLRPSGEPVVADFGLAGLDASSLTKTGQMLGTPAFMAPEQVRGQETTPRTDVWALGLVLYEALYQRHGISTEGAVTALLARICEGQIELPHGGPPGLRALVKACVVVDPSQRPADGSAFLRALRAARAPDPRPRQRFLVAILCALGAVGLGLAAHLVSAEGSSLSASPSRPLLASAKASPTLSPRAEASRTRPVGPRARSAWSHGVQGVRSACFLGDRLVMTSVAQAVLFDREGKVLRRFPGRYELLRAGPSEAWFVDRARTYRLVSSNGGMEEVWPTPALDCDPSNSEFLVRSEDKVEVRRREGTLVRTLELPSGVRTISGFLTPSHVFVSVHQPTLNLVAQRGQGQSELTVYLRLVTRLTAISASADRSQLAIGNADGVVFLTPSAELSEDLAALEEGGAAVDGFRRLPGAHKSPVGQFLFHERNLISVGRARRKRQTGAVLWDTQAHQELASREGQTFTALALSATGVVAVVTPFEVSFVPIADFR